MRLQNEKKDVDTAFADTLVGVSGLLAMVRGTHCADRTDSVAC